MPPTELARLFQEYERAANECSSGAPERSPDVDAAWDRQDFIPTVRPPLVSGIHERGDAAATKELVTADLKRDPRSETG